VAGLARQLALRARGFVYLDEEHIWYTLALSQVVRLPLAEGYELRLATEHDLDAVCDLTTISIDDVRARLGDEAQLWVVVRGSELAFVCWIFPRATPVRAAASRVLELPLGVACLEDSFTAASHRGRGIAGAAWTAIGEGLRVTGFEVLITKVEVENGPSRRAVEKAAFREAGLMRLRRRGRRETVTLEQLPTQLSPEEDGAEGHLERSLRRG
jgi:L-amino acid N-acyltransferase YncA